MCALTNTTIGILTPVFDPDTNMVYVSGKGDGNVRYYEIINEDPWVCYLSQFISGAPHKGFGILPKRGVDVLSCEVFRMYKLHATKDVVEPISMIVPRKSDTFQDDIYPETAAPIAAITGTKDIKVRSRGKFLVLIAEEWLSGQDASPILISMKTGSKTRTYKPVMYKPSEQAIVVSDRNNDRKFMFLSEETRPDYRPKEQRREGRPSPAIDHRPYGAERYQVEI